MYFDCNISAMYGVFQLISIGATVSKLFAQILRLDLLICVQKCIKGSVLMSLGQLG